MKHVLLNIVFLFWGVNSLFSQTNLVLNGNFEVITACPQTMNNLFYAPSLYNTTFGSSVDLYNECSPMNQYSVNIPLNFVGWQNAFSGKGYIGFWTIFNFKGNREYITCLFSKPLIKDSIYLVSMYISTADNSKYAVDYIGAYISKDSIFQNDDKKLPYIPQIESDSGQVLDYLTSWHEIKGLFRAKGGERFITLGCFRKWDDLTWKTYVPPTYIGEGAYYYIDSVTVISYQKPDTIIPPKNPNYTLYPNPASDKITISFEDIEPTEVELELFDMLGRKIIKIHSKLIANKFETNIQFLASGVYLYRLMVDGAYFGDGKLIIVR